MNNILRSEPLKSDLTDEEQGRFKDLEDCIRKGLTTFLEVGEALGEIRDRRLYRNGYKTFEAYCREAWGFSKAHVNRNIAAARANEVLAPIGVKIECESVARPLAGLSEDQMVKAAKKAKEIAGNKPLTAKVVSEAVVACRAEKPGNAAPKPVAKPAAVLVPEVVPGQPTKHLDFKPAFELLARAEKSAAKTESSTLIKDLKALRKVLEALAKAAGNDVTA